MVDSVSVPLFTSTIATDKTRTAWSSPLRPLLPLASCWELLCPVSLSPSFAFNSWDKDFWIGTKLLAAPDPLTRDNAMNRALDSILWIDAKVCPLAHLAAWNKKIDHVIPTLNINDVKENVIHIKSGCSCPDTVFQTSFILLTRWLIL